MTRYVASLDEKLDNLERAHQQAEAFRQRLLKPSLRPGSLTESTLFVIGTRIRAA